MSNRTFATEKEFRDLEKEVRDSGLPHDSRRFLLHLVAKEYLTLKPSRSDWTLHDMERIMRMEAAVAYADSKAKHSENCGDVCVPTCPWWEARRRFLLKEGWHQP